MGLGGRGARCAHRPRGWRRQPIGRVAGHSPRSGATAPHTVCQSPRVAVLRRRPKRRLSAAADRPPRRPRRQLRPREGQAVFLGEHPAGTQRLDTAVATHPPQQLDRRPERRDVVQPPHPAAVAGCHRPTPRTAHRSGTGLDTEDELIAEDLLVAIGAPAGWREPGAPRWLTPTAAVSGSGSSPATPSRDWSRYVTSRTDSRPSKPTTTAAPSTSWVAPDSAPGSGAGGPHDRPGLRPPEIKAAHVPWRSLRSPRRGRAQQILGVCAAPPRSRSLRCPFLRHQPASRPRGRLRRGGRGPQR